MAGTSSSIRSVLFVCLLLIGRDVGSVAIEKWGHDCWIRCSGAFFSILLKICYGDGAVTTGINRQQSIKPRTPRPREEEAVSNVVTTTTTSVTASDRTDRGGNGALRPRLLASAIPGSRARGRARLSVGAAEVRDQLRADREQPSRPDAGGDSPPVDEREQGEALRRGPPGADGVRQHRRRVHHRSRQREPADHGRQPRRGTPVGGDERAALPPGHAHHLRHRRQRGLRRQRHDHDGQPPPRHEGRVRRARRAGPRQPGDRVVGALRERARHQLPAVVGRVPGGPRRVHPAHPRLPRPDGVAVPHQRVPVLRLQGEPGQRVAAVRAVRAQPGRARPQHGPQLRQHAVRPDRRRVRRHEGHEAHGRGRADLRDRVAVQGRRGRDRRHGAERGGVQRQPDAEDRHEPGDAAQAQRARRRVRVRALQREHEARAHVGAELRPVLPKRLAGVRAQRRRLRRRFESRRVAQPVLHVNVLVLVQTGGERNLFDRESDTVTAATSNCNTPTIIFIILLVSDTL